MRWVLAGCAAYAGYGAWLAWRLPWTDGEYTGLPAGAERMRAHNARDEMGPAVLGPVIGGVRRIQYRMPGSYWLYAWARYVPAAWQRPLGRAQSLLVSTAGVGLALTWAHEFGGPRALAFVLLLLLSSAALVGTYATASYEGMVATLWLSGCYALAHDWPGLAVGYGFLLALLRVFAWPQAVLLWLGAPLWGGAAAVLVGGGLALSHGGVFKAGHRAFSRIRPGPDTTWVYAARTLAQRYEPWVGWLALAACAGWPGATSRWLIGLSLVALVAGPGVLAWKRPKWVVGYLPDLALPVVVALGVHLATLPGEWVMMAAGCCVGWGLARPRHGALSGSPFRRMEEA